VQRGDEISFSIWELTPKKFTMSVTVHTVNKCVARFITGHLSTEDERSGRQTPVTIPENVDAIHSMILKNQRITAKNIVETLEISQERVVYIIHDTCRHEKVIRQMGSQMSQF
jgi:predicted HTH transcriptional regulator